MIRPERSSAHSEARERTSSFLIQLIGALRSSAHANARLAVQPVKLEELEPRDLLAASPLSPDAGSSSVHLQQMASDIVYENVKDDASMVTDILLEEIAEDNPAADGAEGSLSFKDIQLPDDTPDAVRSVWQQLIDGAEGSGTDGTQASVSIGAIDTMAGIPDEMNFSEFPDATLEDFGILAHPIAGQLKIWTGAEHRPVISGGALRAHTDGSDHLIVSFLDGSHFLSSLTIDRLDGTDAPILIALMQEDDSVPSYVTLPAGTSTVSINQKASGIQIIQREAGSKLALRSVAFGDEDAHRHAMASTPVPESEPVENPLRTHDFSVLGEELHSDYTVVTFPYLGRVRVSTGNDDQGVRFKNGILQDGRDGFDHLYLSFLDGPKHVESVGVAYISGNLHSTLTGYKNGQKVYESPLLLEGQRELVIDTDIDSFSLTNPQHNYSAFGITNIVTKKEYEDATALRSFEVPQVGVDLSALMANGTAADVVEAFRGKGPQGMPAALPFVNDFRGDVNDAMNSTLAGGIQTILLTIDPSLAPPTEGQVIDAFYAHHPEWRPENMQQLRTQNRWDAYTYSTGLEHMKRKYTWEGLYNYQQDLLTRSVLSVNAVLAAIHGDVTQVQSLRSQISSQQTVLSEIGISFPSLQRCTDAAMRAVFTCWQDICGITGNTSTEMQRERNNQLNGSYAGSGTIDTSQTPPDPNEARREQTIARRNNEALTANNDPRAVASNQHAGSTVASTPTSVTTVAMANPSYDVTGTVVLHEAPPETAYDDLLTRYNGGGDAFIFQGKFVSNMTHVGNIVMNYYYVMLQGTDEEKRAFCERIEEVLGIDARKLYNIAIDHENRDRLEPGIINLFTEAGYGHIFRDELPSAQERSTPTLTATSEKYVYNNEPIRIHWDINTAMRTVSHAALYIVDGVTGEQIWQKMLTGEERDTLHADVPFDAVRALANQNPVKVKVVMWFHEKDADGQNLRIADETESFNLVALPGSMTDRIELPEPNRILMDYLEREVRPTLIEISETEWKSEDEGAGGQCKTWIQQNIVENAFSSEKEIPPNNKEDHSKWILEADSDVQEIGTFEFANMTTENVQAYFSEFSAGDIVQASVMYNSGGYGPHTFIIDEVTDEGMWVYDSNWSTDLDETVRYHFFNFEKIMQWHSATTYRITSAL